MSLSLVTLGAFFHLKAMDAIFHEAINWIPLASLILFNAAYCGGVASLVWTVMSEVLPSNIIGTINKQFMEASTIYARYKIWIGAPTK